MRVASCVVCGERLNVLREKLVTAEWVDAASGALVTMQFHSSCFVRWYQESAASRPGAAASQSGPGPPANRKPSEPGPVAPGAPIEGQQRPPPGASPAAPPPEAYLSPAERERLQELRGRLRERGARPAGDPGGAPGGAGSGRPGDGQHPEDDQQRVHEDDQAPQNE